MSVQRNGSWSQRVLLVFSLLSALSFAATGAAAPPARAQGSEVRIGFQKFTTTLLVLKAQKVLEERLGALGYTVTWTEFPAGLPMLEALNAGSIDFAAVGAGPPIFAQANGTPLVYVLASVAAPQTEAIVLPKESTITEVAQLKGKKVAVQKGSNSHALLAGSLLAAGLTVDDVEIAFLPPADAKAAFEGGNVDAWSIWEPYTAAVEDSSGAKRLVDASFAGQTNRTFYLSPRQWAIDHPDVIAVLDEAINEYELWSKDHRDEVVKLVNSETGIPEATLAKVEDRREFGLEPLNDTIFGEQQAIADLYFDIGLIQNEINVLDATLPVAEGTPASGG